MELNRYDPKPNIGLSQEQVDCRFAEHLTNLDTTPPTKSLKNIFFQNICTLFNLINILLGAAIIYVGAYKNLLILFVILINIIIGITQEIRAKKAVDKLAIIAVNKVKVIRGGKTTEIDISEIVLDDIIILKAGDQVPADAVVLENQCNVNESLLTGESDTIYKGKGDMLLSGSFLTGGNVVAKVEHVGKENYAATILDGAKYIKKIKSEIMSTLKKIVEYISIIIVPIGAILFFNQFHLKDATLRSSVVNTVAALVGMIPEGLVLLTSTVLAIAVIRLSNRKVLVRDLFTIESLARVDVLCLDKTGTITEGTMELSKTVPLCNSAENEVEET
ncbi:MAG: HAD-IC family P-type ATPase, partial [Bacillota bacterium]|nr:HAD-IC family P-type ATPase [Bacillota bacterium]